MEIVRDVKCEFLGNCLILRERWRARRRMCQRAADQANRQADYYALDSQRELCGDEV